MGKHFCMIKPAKISVIDNDRKETSAYASLFAVAACSNTSLTLMLFVVVSFTMTLTTISLSEGLSNVGSFPCTLTVHRACTSRYRR